MGSESTGVVIIGGGMTGVSIGRLLQQAGMDDFVILEKEAEAGGLCRSKVVDGHVVDTGGGHFLASKYPEVYDFIFAHLPSTEFNTFDRVSKITLPDGVIDYPIEYNLWQLPVDRQVEYLISCIGVQQRSTEGAAQTFEKWVRAALGDMIAEAYMIPYNRKIWGVEPDELDTDWLEKIPRFDLRRVLLSCLERAAEKRLMPSHQKFHYPRNGGFQAVFDAILAPVQDHVRLATPATSIRHDGRHWIVNERYAARTVVNTIPWASLAAVTAGVPEMGDDLARVRTTGLVVTLHDDEAYDHDWHWNYVADPDLAHHREFFIRNYAPYSRASGIYRETNPRRFVAGKPALATFRNEHAYPVPVKGHTGAARRVWETFAGLGIIGVGRWGQHRYYNSDVCIREAMRFASGYLAGENSGAIEAMTGAGSRVLT